MANITVGILTRSKKGTFTKHYILEETKRREKKESLYVQTLLPSYKEGVEIGQ